MKSDMHKIVRDNGKIGGDDGYHQRHRSNIKQMIHEEKFDAIPLKESIKPKIDWDDLKLSSVNSKPIKRFLEKNIGRSWNKIYSEIRKKANSNSDTQHVMLNMIEHIVELNAEYVDGIPKTCSFDHSRYELLDDHFYVCPNTKCLKKHKRKKKTNGLKEPERYLLSKRGKTEHTLEKENGIWYYCRRGFIDGHYGLEVHNQLSKKDLKYYKLSNDTVGD